MSIFCTNPSKASKRYAQRVGTMMFFYVLAVYRVTKLVHDRHPTGWKLYVTASLPALPIMAFLVTVGLYLHEEEDEYKRLMVVRSMLVAIGVTLAMTAVVDFLRSYGAISQVPPFTEFVVFWIVMAIAQGVQGLMNRASDDD